MNSICENIRIIYIQDALRNFNPIQVDLNYINLTKTCATESNLSNPNSGLSQVSSSTKISCVIIIISATHNLSLSQSYIQNHYKMQVKIKTVYGIRLINSNDK